MNASEDVKILFRRFGGEANTYQEVVRERAAGQALGKWAMLGQVDILQPQIVESVRRGVTTSATRHVTREPIYAAPSVATVAAVPKPPVPNVAKTVAATPPIHVPQQVAVRINPIELPQVMAPEPIGAVPARAHAAPLRSADVGQSASRSPFSVSRTELPSAPQALAPVVASKPVTTAPMNGHRSALGNRLNARLLHPSSNESAPNPDKQSLIGLFGRLAKSSFSFSGAPHSALQRKFAK
jgi:resuscitation-promoting factor RpfA